MGAAKPLLEVGGVPAVVRVAREYLQVGVRPLVVVGHGADEIVGVLDEEGVDHVFNGEYERGMYSSVVAGVRTLAPACRWILVHPADCVLVRAETIGKLCRRALSEYADVVHPIGHGRRGHPVLVSAGLVPTILQEEPAEGLRELLEGVPTAFDVDVDDPGILLDMDDAADYELVQAMALRESVPGRLACEEMLARYRVPLDVGAHTRAVADVATRLGGALRAAAVPLSLDLITATAMTHDIARGRSDHAAEGAAILETEGYPRVARVVRWHMQLPGEPDDVPGEIEILYLADKLVMGVAVVSLRERLADAEDRFAGDDKARAAAVARLRAAEQVGSRVEGLTGQTLGAIVHDRGHEWAEKRDG
jgi:probable phosphoglycerate mutase